MQCPLPPARLQHKEIMTKVNPQVMDLVQVCMTLLSLEP